MPSDSTTRYHEFPAIKHVTAFDAEGNGPLNTMAILVNDAEPLVRINVLAALTPSALYPASRVTIGCIPLGTMSMTIHQVSTLIEQLTKAREMVVESCPALEEMSDG
jgi:hypothetical protein